MKNIYWFVFAFCAFMMTSCSKEDPVPGVDGMVKTVDSVAMDAQYRLLPMDNGDFIAISQGNVIKVDGRGKRIWKKKIMEFQYLRAAMELPGTGYVLFGVPAVAQSNTSLLACRYDADGNKIDEHLVNANGPANYTSAPGYIIRLHNDGYAIATSSSFSNSINLRILDQDFNLEYSTAIYAPPGYYVINIQNITELPAGNFAISASASGSTSLTNAWVHPVVLLANAAGVTQTLWVTGDSLHSNVPTIVAPCQRGFFVMSAGMGSWGGDQGAFVDYYGATYIAGRIRLDQFDDTGLRTGGRQFTGYPGFGLVHSVRASEKDGGYFLCGTVGNNSSSISVSKTKIYVCKLDAALNEVWSKVIETTYQAIGVDAIPTFDGGCMVAGNLKSFNKNYQMLMIKMDANGNY